MEITPDMLERYFRGACSEDEKSAIRTWMDAADETEEVLEGVPFSPRLEARLKNKIQRAMDHEGEESKNRVFPQSRWLLAASVVLLMGLGVFFWLSNNDTNYQTQAGELQTISLSDGTEVTLNAGSKLSVPRSFGRETRSVQLDGEAFFRVKADSLHPFTVETAASVTRVLGTQFNLSAYANEAMTLTLSEGKVSFSALENDVEPAIIVQPGEQVVLKGGVMEKGEIDPSFSQAWMKKKLVFRGATFAEVAREIERFYGVNIRIEKAGLANRLYRGTHDNPSLPALMKKLSFVLKFNYRSENNTIIIY